VIIVSPHLDDGVFSCGRLLAANPGATLLTVFAAAPEHHRPLAPWDAKVGFTSSRDAVLTRRMEDERACEVLGASPVWLDALDRQYQPARRDGFLGRNWSRVKSRYWLSQRDAGVARQLQVAFGVHGLSHIVVPLGIGHPDHVRVAELCRQAATALRVECVTVYAELPYGDHHPEKAEAAVRSWQRLGWALTSHQPRLGSGPAKAAAVACYQSQHEHFPPEVIAAGETYWTATAPRGA